jgi:hypothetical protein
MTVKESEYPELLADWKELVNSPVAPEAAAQWITYSAAFIRRQRSWRIFWEPLNPSTQV